jgi:hypothetical protein
MYKNIVDMILHVGMTWCLRENKRIAPLSFFHGYRKRQQNDKELGIAITPEIGCDQTAMRLPPITSAVFLIAKCFW